jgi:hypothetical protein
MSLNQTSTRIHFLWARNAPEGVVFRRGPSKHVQLLRWNLKTDKIEAGQWFKGRIYERRCDLSPSGEFLIYFAGKYKEPYRTWTAISRPPYFSALALWPKGDAWGGGGLFKDNSTVLLNHRQNEMNLDPKFALPKKFKIIPYGERPGWGEDDPIFSSRLMRDGWEQKSSGKDKKNKFGSNIWIEFHEPQVWEKKIAMPNATLWMELHGIMERDGPWYVLSYKYQLDQEVVDLGKCDWADINSSGYVYFAKDGCIFRQFGDRSIKLIIDLSSNQFEEVSSPPYATTW